MLRYVPVVGVDNESYKSPMAYEVIKTVKGKKYRYRQTSFRQGGKVRTKSVYLGPVSAIATFIGDQIRRQTFGLDEDAANRQFNEREARDAADRQAKVDQLHASYGLRLPGEEPAEQSQTDAAEKAP